MTDQKNDPDIWVLLPKDEADYQYEDEPLIACLSSSSAEDHREIEEERKPERYVPASRLAEAFNLGFEHAVKKLEQHCCVSTCCDAQPGSGTAEELAKCLRKNRDVGRTT